MLTRRDALAVLGGAFVGGLRGAAQSPVRLRSSPTGGGAGGFDTSEYRQDTYGRAPDYYCDCTRSLASNGTGTLGDPWNVNQAKANAVAGDIVGFLPVGSGTPVDLATTNNDNIPAFNPTNSGTSGSRIVFVTKYAATYLVGRDGRATIASNQDRSELRHDGVAPSIVSGVGAGDGCAIYGSNGKDYITYDGFFTDMSQAYMREDSGVIRAEDATGIHFKNFVIKGATLTVASNPVVYRPQGAVDTVLSNFLAYDFVNDSTGSNTPQDALFSDQYGDQNFLIEHFWIDGIATGPFPKGSDGVGNLNYGTFQYGIVSDCRTGFRFNAQDATEVTTVAYCLVYDYTEGAITLSGETIDVRNLLVHHCTFARGDSSNINMHGAIYCKPLGSNIEIRDCICDLTSGTYGHGFDAGEATTMPATLNYMAYYEGASTETWAFNGTEYNTLANWRTATSRDANSIVLSTDPFVDRTNGDLRVSNGHAAKTASSTAGEVGAYATSETVGPITS